MYNFLIKIKKHYFFFIDSYLLIRKRYFYLLGDTHKKKKMKNLVLLISYKKGGGGLYLEMNFNGQAIKWTWERLRNVNDSNRQLHFTAKPKKIFLLLHEEKKHSVVHPDTKVHFIRWWSNYMKSTSASLFTKDVKIQTFGVKKKKKKSHFVEPTGEKAWRDPNPIHSSSSWGLWIIRDPLTLFTFCNTEVDMNGMPRGKCRQ